jgi:acyl-CoA thioester hydrolase
MKIRIYYHHTDCGGVVYYANYLAFLEEARTEFFEQSGYSIKELTERGVLFVVGRQEIDYKCPARYGDILEVKSHVSGNSAVRLDFDGEIRNQDGVLVSKAKTVLVCVDRNFKPQAIPADILEKIKPKG